MQIEQINQSLKYPNLKSKQKPPETSLNNFYQLKKENRLAEAQEVLYEVLAKDPNNKEALLELGYFYLDQKNPEMAWYAFEKATPLDYNTILQKAYILDGLKRHKEAYDQFQIASTSPDLKIAQEAKNSMIYLAPEIYKSLPSPWFADLYFAPEYHSRYSDMIFSGQLRTGVSWETSTQILEIYGSIRFDGDTKSTASGAYPQIYQDNTAIFALGARYYAYKPIPIYLYAEAGESYDLVYQNESRWQPDFRGGISGYQNWGANPVYAFNPRFVCKQFGDGYGDISFYSRYDDNIIGQLRLREGIRFFEWKNSSLDVYLKGEMFFDTNHEYYNNLAEFSPGLAFTPYNQVNLVFRFEPTWGYYIPVNSPSENPYGSSYYDTVILAEFYIRL